MRTQSLLNSPSFREAGAFSAAELASIAVSLGVVGVADEVAPNLIKKGSKALSKAIIEPNLDTIERILGKFCKLEECKIDPNQGNAERAERLAHISIVFGAAWASAMLTKFLTRRYLTRKIPEHDPTSSRYKYHPDDEKVWGVTKHEWKLFGADEGVHYGSLLLFNTGAAKVTDELIRTCTRILVKCGVPEKKAHELSSMAWIWEVPNLLGAAAGVGVISQYNNHNWGQKL